MARVEVLVEAGGAAQRAPATGAGHGAPSVPSPEEGTGALEAEAEVEAAPRLQRRCCESRFAELWCALRLYLCPLGP